MKNLVILLLSFLLIFVANAQFKNVLFLGNSYTYVNDLPNTLEQLANSFGDSLIHDQNTPGGHNMQGHSINTTSLGKIAIGDWDFVAIQSQSQEPSFSPAQVATDVYPYAAIICDSIRAADQCAEPLFFMTWGRKNGDASNCPFYPPICTYDGMQNRLRESYLEMAVDNDASVSPVGAVWKQVRDSLPALELYSPDESHPSVAGTYVAACTFYAAIWRKSPVGSSFISTLSASDAQAIQQLAERVVLDSLITWRIGNNDVVADWSISQLSGLAFEFVNATNNSTSISWDFGDGNSGTGDTIVHSYLSAGTFQVQMIASNGCMSDTLVQTVNAITTTIQKDNVLPDLHIYPNPSNSQITIQSQDQLHDLFLYNQNGKRVRCMTNIQSDNVILNLSFLPKGSYVLKLSNNDTQIIERIIKVGD
ncbi:MAG: T9SS type A sorting domain-containing protein [Crocinitomicaceae bacterium]|nr:T9SS type A sorting domain-containing protein [Crocinitomicaceae bacterium]